MSTLQKLLVVNTVLFGLLLALTWVYPPSEDTIEASWGGTCAGSCPE